MTAPHSISSGTAEALVAKWRAEAKRHEAAAQEPGMDEPEYTLHDEAHRVYTKCADDLASTCDAAQAKPEPVPFDGEAAIREAAESAAVGAQIIRSDGDLLVYYSGFNLSRFVRYLALASPPAALPAGRTWDVAISERVMQLEAAGANVLSISAVLGLIAFVRDGEGSVVSSTPQKTPGRTDREGGWNAARGLSVTSTDRGSGT